jgi:hypothetical protein
VCGIERPVRERIGADVPVLRREDDEPPRQVHEPSNGKPIAKGPPIQRAQVTLSMNSVRPSPSSCTPNLWLTGMGVQAKGDAHIVRGNRDGDHTAGRMEATAHPDQANDTSWAAMLGEVRRPVPGPFARRAAHVKPGRSGMPSVYSRS